jgi:hypothetical protein
LKGSCRGHVKWSTKLLSGRTPYPYLTVLRPHFNDLAPERK